MMKKSILSILITLLLMQISVSVWAYGAGNEKEEAMVKFISRDEINLSVTPVDDDHTLFPFFILSNRPIKLRVEATGFKDKEGVDSIRLDDYVNYLIGYRRLFSSKKGNKRLRLYIRNREKIKLDRNLCNGFFGWKIYNKLNRRRLNLHRYKDGCTLYGGIVRVEFSNMVDDKWWKVKSGTYNDTLIFTVSADS